MTVPSSLRQYTHANLAQPQSSTGTTPLGHDPQVSDPSGGILSK